MNTACITSWFSGERATARVFRILLGGAVAFVVWMMSSKAPFVVITGLAFIFALTRFRSCLRAWLNPAGIAFALFAAYLLATLPFGKHPDLAARSMAKVLPIVLAAFALPAILNTEARVRAALVVSATVVTIVLAADLCRLVVLLDGQVCKLARITLPYVMNHPNVASIMAGASFFVLIYTAWHQRHVPLLCTLAILGALTDLTYLVVLQSRGPQVAFAAACALSGFLLPGWRPKVIWVLLLLIGGALLAANIQHINPRFKGRDLPTLNRRNIVWQHAWKLCQQHPVIGHGYGKSVFRQTYYSRASHPPPSRYIYPHTHHYWLQTLFEAGWIGVALLLSAWILLLVRLLRNIGRQATLRQRLLPSVILLALAIPLAYGWGDYPDSIVQIMQIWLIPLALVVTRLSSAEPAPTAT